MKVEKKVIDGKVIVTLSNLPKWPKETQIKGANYRVDPSDMSPSMWTNIDKIQIGDFVKTINYSPVLQPKNDPPSQTPRRQA